MSEEQSDGPIHQAFWVFPVTLLTCYGFLALLLFAKYISGGMELSELPWAVSSQAILFVGFMVVFGVFFGFVKTMSTAQKS